MNYIGIDPSTKTGLVVIDSLGQVVEALEINKNGTDPARMFNLVSAVASELLEYHQTKVAIEGFGFASQRAIQLGGIGWGIRMRMYELGIDYIEVAPGQLKNFVGAKGNSKKDIVAVEVYKRWGFESKSDNIRDAYVLAQIARAMSEDVKLTKFQNDVIKKIKGNEK